MPSVFRVVSVVVAELAGYGLVLGLSWAILAVWGAPVALIVLLPGSAAVGAVTIGPAMIMIESEWPTITNGAEPRGLWIHLCTCGPSRRASKKRLNTRGRLVYRGSSRPPHKKT